jgi:hypothetical protein
MNEYLIAVMTAVALIVGLLSYILLARKRVDKRSDEIEGYVRRSRELRAKKLKSLESDAAQDSTMDIEDLYPQVSTSDLCDSSKHTCSPDENSVLRNTVYSDSSSSDSFSSSSSCSSSSSSSSSSCSYD